MIGSRTLAALAITAVLLLAGCGGNDSLTESGLEELIERESGEDIDLDFDSDGGFTIDTDEGTIQFDADGDGDGTITFDTDEGEGSIQFDADGDGDGTITFDTDEGEGSINVESDDGSVVIETDEGSTTMIGGAIPDDWPTWIGVPDTMKIDQTVFSVVDDNDMTIFTAQFTHDPAEDFAAAVVARAVAEGFEPDDGNATIGGQSFTSLTRGEAEGLQVFGLGAGATSVTYEANRE